MSAADLGRLTAYLDRLVPAATPYLLRRDVDVSGVSGTGVVAEGVYFSPAAGSVAVTRWRGARGSTVAWDHGQDVEAIHGHDGATELVILPVPALIAALRDITTLADQHGDDPWASGWREALRTVHGVIANALAPHLADASHGRAVVE